jgi:ubiquinone/menaquinone biosynthesis C-methylase UbiE
VDESFDAYLTLLGARFAPRPEKVASEAARVLKPGGLLVMANWNPASFTGKMFRTGAKHVPPPPGVAPPVLWGDEATVQKRLAPFFEEIEMGLVPIEFAMSTSPAGAVEFFRTYFGPTKVAFSKLDESGKQALQDDLVALWTEHNTSAAPGRTLVPNEFLRVVAKRKA